MLPFVYIKVATSADGKLTLATRHFEAFGGREDHARMLELRSDADAVMAGARTVDLMPVNPGPGPAVYREKRRAGGRQESQESLESNASCVADGGEVNVALFRAGVVKEVNNDTVSTGGNKWKSTTGR